eukprot:GEZU01027376.1.p2 GENE.GEZU01027376.1~~GEZU01027376.1.p2  ORF type:complete len:164 (-),score=32.28 GEZU01027376.1:322-813(-)
MDEFDRVYHFRNGLTDKYREHVVEKKLATLDENMEYALEYCQTLKQSRRSKPEPSHQGNRDRTTPRHQGHNQNRPRQQNSNPRSQRQVENVQNTDNNTKVVTIENNRRRSRPLLSLDEAIAKGVCRNCGKPGHIKINCPELSEHQRASMLLRMQAKKTQPPSR